MELLSFVLLLLLVFVAVPFLFEMVLCFCCGFAACSGGGCGDEKCCDFVVILSFFPPPSPLSLAVTSFFPPAGLLHSFACDEIDPSIKEEDEGDCCVVKVESSTNPSMVMLCCSGYCAFENVLFLVADLILLLFSCAAAFLD